MVMRGTGAIRRSPLWVESDMLASLFPQRRQLPTWVLILPFSSLRYCVDLGLEALEREPDCRRGAGIGDEIGRDREVAARNTADLERLADGLERPVRAKLGAGPAGICAMSGPWP